MLKVPGGSETVSISRQNSWSLSATESLDRRQLVERRSPHKARASHGPIEDRRITCQYYRTVVQAYQADSPGITRVADCRRVRTGLIWYSQGVVMVPTLPADLQNLQDALDAAERDSRAVVAGLTEARGSWHADAGSWSVAECLDHLATANRVYLGAMEPSAARARRDGRQRRGPARPGSVGGWFVSYL